MLKLAGHCLIDQPSVEEEKESPYNVQQFDQSYWQYSTTGNYW